MQRNLRRLISQGCKLDLGRCLHTSASAQQSSTAAAEDAQLAQEKPRSICRTPEDDPASHTDDHVGQYYTIPLAEMATVFPHGPTARFKLQMAAFQEAALMVRKPGLELIHYLKHTSQARPSVRYVLYGERGTGKTLTLCHAVHYCARQNWVILHIPNMVSWVRASRELLPSSYNAERLDQPLEASTWLGYFKTTNHQFLNRIKTRQKYMWNKRESTDEGRPLGEVVDQGLTRIRNATDSIGVVFKELKAHCQQGEFKLLVAVDGVNCLWGKTALKKLDKSEVLPEELSLIHNLRKMVANDWTGGAIAMTVNQAGVPEVPPKAYLPYDLLGKEGFEALDPFVPIQVSNFTDREFEGCYRYYQEHKWLQHSQATTDEGRLEIRFLTGRNPGLMERMCSYL